MKTKTYIHLSFLIPYILWFIFLGVATITSRVSDNASTSTSFNSIINTITTIYVIGIFLWGIPYTVLAVGLWLWSRSRDLQKTTRVLVFSPFFLAILMMLQTLAFSLNWSDMANGYSQLSSDFGASILALGGFSVLFGYLCIGLAAGLYKILKSLNVISKEDRPISPTTIDQPAI
jgi:hypothetical protein